MTEHLVDAQGITRFLQRLAQCYRHPGTVYLVGGTSLILLAAKESTFDIDLQFDVQATYHTEFVRCLRQVSRELHFPVEQASPEQFIPLPKGFEDRRQFIARFGALDIFHFDLYSIALSKLHRGNEKDFADVTALVQQGLIEFIQLERYFQEILPQLETYLTANPEGFMRRFTLFKEKVAGQNTDAEGDAP